jgi:hypothetical protein
MIFAILMLIFAVLASSFWITWFREDHDQEWLPSGYIEHERIFVWSDAMMSIVLVAGAVLLIADKDLGERLALVAAGMLAFLGVLDLAYFAQNDMFRRDHDGIANIGIVVGALALSAALFVRYGIAT